MEGDRRPGGGFHFAGSRQVGGVQRDGALVKIVGGRRTGLDAKEAVQRAQSGFRTSIEVKSAQVDAVFSSQVYLPDLLAEFGHARQESRSARRQAHFSGFAGDHCRDGRSRHAGLTGRSGLSRPLSADIYTESVSWPLRHSPAMRGCTGIGDSRSARRQRSPGLAMASCDSVHCSLKAIESPSVASKPPKCLDIVIRDGRPDCARRWSS